MHRLDKNRILDEITTYYLQSSDFNGISSSELSSRFGVKFNELCSLLIELIIEKKVGILYDHPLYVNPHIIRLGFDSENEQILRLMKTEPPFVCLYPRPAHLQEIVNQSDYTDQPYKLSLALGLPQLEFRSFDLSVLEFYRNDPRYSYENNEIVGRIYYDSEQLTDSDKVLFEHFSFSYDSEFNRSVAVFLRYLVRLSPEHQQIWKSKELKGNYILHPDYFGNTILGMWGQKVSIFEAFLAELRVICSMTSGINRPSLFREDYGGEQENKPRKFGFLIRSTLEEFNDFIHLLDKMISENIDKQFFQNEVSYENEIERQDGKIIVQQKGTLRILDEWIRMYCPSVDWKSWDEAIQVFQEVRKKRQQPAHVVKKNVFDQKYFKEQRELMIRVYNGMRTLRMMLANLSEVRNVDIEIPDYLQEGAIWTF